MILEGITDDRLRARTRVDRAPKVLGNDALHHLVYAAPADLARAQEAKDPAEKQRHLDDAETRVATALGTLNRQEARS